MAVAEKWRERQGVASLTLYFLLIFCEIFDFFAIFFNILNIERRFFGKPNFSKSFFSQKKKYFFIFFWWSVYIKSSSMLIFMMIEAFWPLRQRKNRQNRPKMQVIRSLAFWSSYTRNYNHVQCDVVLYSVLILLQPRVQIELFLPIYPQRTFFHGVFPWNWYTSYGYKVHGMICVWAFV